MNRAVGPTRAPLTLAAPPTPEVREADLDMMGLVRLLRRRIWSIGFITAALTAAAIPVLLSSDPVYHARTRFLVQPVLSAEIEDAPVLSLNDEVERLRRRTIAEEIVARFDLDEREEFNAKLAPPGPLDRVRAFLTGAEADEEEEAPDPSEADKILNAYYGRLSVWRETESQLIQVGFTSRDPELAGSVPNAIVEIYRTDREGTHSERVEGAIHGLDLRIEALRDDLAEAKEELAEFRAENDVDSGIRFAALESGRMALLDQQLSGLADDRGTIAARIAAFEAAEEAEAIADTVLPGEPDGLLELRESLEERRREYDRVAASHGPGYPPLRTELARVSDLEIAVETQVGAWIDTMRIALEHIDARREALLAARAEGEVTLSRSLRVEAAEAALVHRIAVLREGLSALEERHRSLMVRRQQAALDLEVLAPAVPPTRPEGRSRKTNLALCGVAALMAALTFAGIREAMDNTVRSLSQFGDLPGLVPVGTLPRPRLTFRLRRAPQADPIMMDALRAALTRLRSMDNGQLPASIAVTEGRAGDGAHVVAELLAGELAATGRPVLVVDARPRARRDRLGLADYLRAAPAGAAAASSLLDRLIVRSSGNGPHLLHRGTGRLPVLRGPGSILPLLDHAAKRDMTVIFACPSVMSSASALQVAAAATRSMLVLRWGRTPRPLVQLATERLRATREGPVLALLHDVPARRARLYPFPDAAAFAVPGPKDIW